MAVDPDRRTPAPEAGGVAPQVNLGPAKYDLARRCKEAFAQSLTWEEFVERAAAMLASPVAAGLPTAGEMAEALRPFGEYGALGVYGDDSRTIVSNHTFEDGMAHITVGDFRRAAAILARLANTKNLGGPTPGTISDASEQKMSSAPDGGRLRETVVAYLTARDAFDRLEDRPDDDDPAQDGDVEVHRVEEIRLRLAVGLARDAVEAELFVLAQPAEVRA